MIKWKAEKVTKYKTWYSDSSNTCFDDTSRPYEAVAYRGGGVQMSSPPKKIPKALQNRAKLNPIVKTAKNSWIYDANTPRCSEKRQ